MSALAEALRARLAARERERLELEGFRRAAVLVPLLESEGGPELLFTVRSAALSNHAGQIAFPGGRLDPGESIEEAARRETLEEVGLEVPPSAILGRLDEHPSPAGYIVTPVLAVLPWPQPLRPNPAEVDGIFTASIAALSAITPRTEERQLRAYRRRLHFYDFEGQLIWGLTGNVLQTVLELFEPSAAGSAA